jgi:hypothetical protein
MADERPDQVSELNGLSRAAVKAIEAAASEATKAPPPAA